MPAAVTLTSLAQLDAGPQAAGGPVTRINLAADLDTVPPRVFDYADTLEVLDLSGNGLAQLPDTLPHLHRLRILFCSANAFTALPAILGACPRLEMVGFKSNRIAEVPSVALPPHLRWLILTDNAVEALPETVGRCRNLQKLMLAGNRLTGLPDALAACHRLELVRLAANRLPDLPDCLRTLPRLAWLAFAGNPFCAADEAAALAQAPAATVSWSELELHERLGEGASGTIYRARRPGHGATEYAVKLFKGAMTSDGLPHSEMAACLAAGEHPNRIPALARIAGHPDATDGLLMPLIDTAYRSLAGPPSLASCTRDIYPPDRHFPLANALRIAHGIASLAASLHARGIMHGDLYAHNILHCDAGRALLGDFGAASFYAGQTALAAQLERIEVRAFGCLLDELLARSPSGPDHAPVRTRLATLAADCCQPAVFARPAFGALVDELDAALAGLPALPTASPRHPANA